MQKASIKQNEEQCWRLVAGHKHEGVIRTYVEKGDQSVLCRGSR